MPSWDRLLSLCQPTAQLARGNGARRIGQANTEMTNPRTASTPAAVEGDPCEHHATPRGGHSALEGAQRLFRNTESPLSNGATRNLSRRPDEWSGGKEETRLAKGRRRTGCDDMLLKFSAQG